MIKEPHIIDISHIKVTGARCSNTCDSTEYWIGAATQVVSETKRRKLKLYVCCKCGRKYVTKKKSL